MKRLLEMLDRIDMVTAKDGLSDEELKIHSETRQFKTVLEDLLSQLAKHDTNKGPEIPVDAKRLLEAMGQIGFSSELAANHGLSDDVLKMHSEARKLKLVLEGSLSELVKQDTNNASDPPVKNPATLADSPKLEVNATPNADTIALLRDLFNDRACLTRAQALLQARERTLVQPTLESDQEEEGDQLTHLIMIARRIAYNEALNLYDEVKLGYLSMNMLREMDRFRPEAVNRNLDDMKKTVAQEYGWSVEKLSECLTEGEQLEAVTGGHLGLMYLLPFGMSLHFEESEKGTRTVDGDIYSRELKDLQAGKAYLAKLDRLKEYCGIGMKLGAFLRGETEDLDETLREALDPKYDYEEMSQAEVEAIMNRVQEMCACAN